jgi:MtN3 and saliva related transmembrane protein
MAPERVAAFGYNAVSRARPWAWRPEFYQDPVMEIDGITLLGFLAATLTTLAFLPQVIKSWRSKVTRDISLGMFLILTAGIILWLTYGILVADLPLIAANTVTLVLAVTMLYLKLRYK